MAGLQSSTPSSLLAALSDAIGQPLALDERGECGLEFDGWVDLFLGWGGDGDMLSVRASVTGAGQQIDPELLQGALCLNYSRVPPGYSVALDIESRQLVLVALVDAARTSEDEFLRVVAGFLELVPQLRAHFFELRASADASSLMRTGATV